MRQRDNADEIAAVWALGFAAKVVADLLLDRSDLPPRSGVVVTVLALIGAVSIIGWFPERKAAS